MRLQFRLASLLLVGGIWSISTGWARAGDEPKLDKKVVDIVMKAGDVIKKAKTLHAEGTIEANGQGEDKQKINVALSYDIEKPNRLALHSQRGDDKNAGVDVVSDGKMLITHARRLKQYTEKEAPENVADIAVSLPRLTIPNVGLLFRNILTDNPGETLMQGVTSCTNVGQEKIDGVNAHHLKFSQPEFEWELWVAAEGTPYLLQMKSTLAQDDNKLVVTETYKNWKIDEPVGDKTFTFTPPKDAKKVKLLGPAQEQDD
jgi:hypothetical protein